MVKLGEIRNEIEENWTWEEAIVQCFVDYGGCASNDEIYRKIKDYIELKEEHLKTTYGRPNYFHQIRRHLTNFSSS
jgi:hypothetical protein